MLSSYCRRRTGDNYFGGRRSLNQSRCKLANFVGMLPQSPSVQEENATAGSDARSSGTGLRRSMRQSSAFLGSSTLVLFKAFMAALCLMTSVQSALSPVKIIFRSGSCSNTQSSTILRTQIVQPNDCWIRPLLSSDDLFNNPWPTASESYRTSCSSRGSVRFEYFTDTKVCANRPFVNLSNAISNSNDQGCFPLENENASFIFDCSSKLPTYSLIVERHDFAKCRVCMIFIVICPNCCLQLGTMFADELGRLATAV